MTECDDVLEAALLGHPLDGERADHARGCGRCRRELAAIAHVTRLLATEPIPGPPPALGRAVLAAAAPILAARRRAETTGYRRALAGAVAAALVPLPLVIAFDVYLWRAAHAVLRTLLPGLLSVYLAFNIAALMLLALALAYGAVPFLVHRQLRPARPPGYA
jgi:hypothetical protein